MTNQKNSILTSKKFHSVDTSSRHCSPVAQAVEVVEAVVKESLAQLGSLSADPSKWATVALDITLINMSAMEYLPLAEA
eukprot:1096855-Amphidinium_carterae.1